MADFAQRFTRVTRSGLMLAVALAGGGCVYFPRATPRPLPMVASTNGAPAASTLVVFLPGRGDRMEDFEREGLRAVMTQAGIRADWIAVDAHLGYYLNRSVVDALRADVLQPARARGYRRIVVVGVSLGGLGALLCARDAPGLTDALVLLAPYLGDRAGFFAEVQRAGGPAAWAAGRSGRADDVAVELWTFLGQQHARLPPTWLGWGESDRLAAGHRLLAPLLPTGRVRVIAGGHTWPIWRELWRALCEESELFVGEKRAPMDAMPSGR
jgi:pimeloyl-ACP methyl ester carboxylesterase